MQADSDGSDGHDQPHLHPQFCSSEADVILGAKNGTLFRAHSYALKTTSAWFRAMFSLPQNPKPVKSELDMVDVLQINVDEAEHVLESLFRMICGLPIPAIDTIYALLFAAEKYDMPEPISIIRMLIMTPFPWTPPLLLCYLSLWMGTRGEICIHTNNGL
jgi:hypothetical protein